MGLDTLDEFSPKDTDPVSLGDDAIRATRAATKQSFGVEHYLDGPHKVPQGTEAVRPAAGRAGRLYYNTDKHVLQFDDGTQWAGPRAGVAPSTILWHSANISVAAGGNDLEIPFDSVLDDPGGFASAQPGRIVMPANVIGIVFMYLQTSAATGGFGGLMSIEQFDPSTSTFKPVVQAFNQGPLASFWCLSGMVDSRWGTILRGTVTNGTSSALTISATALGASPRFGFTLLGATS